jgi:hypothetical protein
VTPDVLTDRALNRATLARQLLIERSSMDPGAAIEHLVGLQSQNPLDPYLALWSRIAAFDPHVVGSGLEARSLVRMVVMRGTIHLVTASDALGLRPLMQPVLDTEIARHSELARFLVGVDLDPVLAFARQALADRPMTAGQLRAVLAEQFPALHPGALAYASRCRLALVQVPPRGVWGKTLQVTSTPVESWLGRPLDDGVRIDDVLLRYVRAYGPATVADATAWSRLTGIREVFDRVRPRLRVWHDERGRELFDTPDAVLVDADTPAPVRFLPEYDNALLAYADRARFAPRDPADLTVTDGSHWATVLVDGRIRARWRIEHDRKASRVVVMVRHGRLTRRASAALAAEGRRVARFLHADAADVDVQLVPVS